MKKIIIFSLFSLFLLGIEAASKKQPSQCPPTSQALALTFNGVNSITNGATCTTYYFDVPTFGTSDLKVTANTNAAESFDLYLTRAEKYTGTSPQYDYNFVAFNNQTFLIPNCVLTGTTRWYLNVDDFTANTVGTISFVLVTGTPLTQGSQMISGVLSNSYNWFYGQFNPANGQQGLQVSFSISTGGSGFTTLLVNLGSCPTQAESTTYAPYLNTVSANEPIYFGFYSDDVIQPIDFNISITTQPTQCKTPQGLNICAQYVNYASTVWNSTIVAQDESLIEFVLLFTSPPAACTPTLTHLLCISEFPKCDSNGFPLYPCLNDCTDFESKCSGVLNGGNCSTASYPSGVGTFCYLGSSSTILPSIFLLLSLAIFSFLN